MSAKAIMRLLHTYRNSRLKQKILTTPNSGEDVEKLDHSYFDGDNVKWHSHSEKFLMKLTKHAVSFNPAIVVLGICPREMKACCLSLFGLLLQSTTYCVAI